MRAIEKLLRRGIRRVGTARAGFRYVSPAGGRPSRADLERIRALRLPPAWTDVHVSPLAAAKLQAIGRDRAGRWQYRYHPEFARRQAAAKYRRLLRFATSLPRLRGKVERDMRRRGLARERVLAAMVRILESCHIRPGSEAYARENRSYGLSTIRPRHVRVSGDLVVFDFRGKSGQRQIRELRHPRVARLVRELLRVPGRDVFKFVEGGEVVDVRRRHLNAYIREAAGAPFTAKDFRTWAGTLLCASELAQAAANGATPASRKRTATAALRAVATRLGNTPAVVRSSYVSPAVLHGFARGHVIGCCLAPEDLIGIAGRTGLHDAERALAELLRASAPRAPNRAALRLVRGGSRGVRTGPLRPTGATAKPLARAARADPR